MGVDAGKPSGRGISVPCDSHSHPSRTGPALMVPPDGVDGMPARSTVFLPRTYDPRCHDLPVSVHRRAMSIPASSTWAASTDETQSGRVSRWSAWDDEALSEPNAESSHKFRQPPCSSRHQVTLNPTSCPYRAELPQHPALWGSLHCDRRWCPWRIGVREIVSFPIGCRTSVEARW